MADPPEIAAQCSFDFVRPRLPPPPARVLEVGCGQGHLSALLAAEGYRVVALDASPEAVELARRRGVDAHRAEWMTFEASPFDAAGAALLSSLIDAERRAISTSMIRPVGRRFVCSS